MTAHAPLPAQIPIPDLIEAIHRAITPVLEHAYGAATISCNWRSTTPVREAAQRDVALLQDHVDIVEAGTILV